VCTHTLRHAGLCACTSGSCRPCHVAVHERARGKRVHLRAAGGKPVRGLSEGPPSCYCLWFEYVVGQGARVLRTHSRGGQTLPKPLLAHARGEVGAPSPVGPQVGDGCEEVGLHIQAELLWGGGAARRPSRAPAWPRTSPSPFLDDSPPPFLDYFTAARRAARACDALKQYFVFSKAVKMFFPLANPHLSRFKIQDAFSVCVESNHRC
jgi:hypothetical protein